MLERTNIIATMSRPILVHGSDMHYHYCKYHRAGGQAYRLYKEYLIARFVSIWEFYSSPVNLLKVRPEDIPVDLGIPRKSFEYPCFALQEVRLANELDKQSITLLTESGRTDELRDEFLKCCFFDIWTANEDRSHNNYNLLLVQENKHSCLFPIDHEACFNHGELKQPLIPITYEESLIYSEAFARLFTTHNSAISPARLATTRTFYYIYMQKCREALAAIMASIPADWGIDVQKEATILARFLFDEQWFSTAWTTFLEYIGYYRDQI